MTAAVICRTVIEDNEIIVGAVAQRDAELIDNVCLAVPCVVKGRFGIGYACRIVSVQTTAIGILVDIGMGVCACCTSCWIGRVLGRYRCNARPDRVAGSLPVVLTEIAAAVEVSVDVIFFPIRARAASGLWQCKVYIIAVCFDLVGVVKLLIEVVVYRIILDKVIAPGYKRCICDVVDIDPTGSI